MQNQANKTQRTFQVADNTPMLPKSSDGDFGDLYGNRKYKVALYCRLSKEDDHNASESESIQNQKILLTRFAQERDFCITQLYVDDGFSGGNYDRPAFQQMIRDIEKGEINMVLTKDLSRLGRDYIETGYYIEKYFPSRGVRYISLLDHIDTATESAINDITPFKAILNDFFARDISKKIKSVKHDKMQRGLFIGGKASYGYIKSKTDKNRIEIDEKAASVVQKIFALALMGKSAREIAMHLTEEEVQTPSEYAGIRLSKQTAFTNMWKAETVAAILKNEVYIGHMIQGKMKKVSYKLKKNIRQPAERWVRVDNTHEGIVEQEVFEKVQELLQKRRTVKTRTFVYPLKGLLFCKECGMALGAVSKKDIYYLRCRTYAKFPKQKKCTPHSIRADRIELAIINWIRSVYFANGSEDMQCKMRKIVEEEWGQLEQSSSVPTEKNMLLLEQESHTLNTIIDQIYTDKIKGILSEQDFVRMYAVKKEEREEIEKRKKEYSDRKREPCLIEEERIDSIITSFFSVYSHKELIFTNLLQRIEIDNDKRIYIFTKS